MRPNWYVGHFDNQSEEFQSSTEPTKLTHPKYDFITGEFPDEAKAISYKRWFNMEE
jgi:outer membrane protease